MMKNPPHPGEMLREDVLQPLGLEVTEAAQRLGMSRTTLSRVINGRAGISPDLAVRVARGCQYRPLLDGAAGQLRAGRAEQRKQPKVQPLQDTA